MPYCSNCGTQMSDGASVCPQCGHPRVVTRRTEGLAVASLILGIAGFVICPLIPSILAIILGNRAVGRIRTDPALEGESLAKAGIILGWIGVALAALGLVLVVIALVVAGTGTSTGSFTV